MNTVVIIIIVIKIVIIIVVYVTLVLPLIHLGDTLFDNLPCSQQTKVTT